ncbi:hypothetical protein AQUCO_05000036v1 [Aquilegia coerulea]|uniref:Glabrous enhancer-binding protein-like DBD domain-containing protein n=1 Tax=Aquilegia coerulea TaxID=218851 RepID=A0A2G5CJD8_AQUCA|nr:hypothetical protein AQUCO_05000036v1 [Aquilegia coerulea]
MTSPSSSSCSSYEDDTVITEPGKIVVQQNLANQEVTQNLEDGKEDDDSSSSEGEEEEDSGDDDDEEEEGEREKHTNQKNDVEEKEEEEQESDEEEEEVQEKNEVSKDEVFSTPAGSNSKKRSFNRRDDIVDAKDQQPNTKPKTIGSDSKNWFVKLWSNKDEIVLLKAMVDYGKLTSASDYEIILKSIKNSLSFDYTIKQLKNKVDNFAKKYRKLEYGQPKAKGLKFKEPHDAKVYQFLKTYYGGEEKEQNEGDQPSEAIKVVHRRSSRNKNKLNANSRSSGLVSVIVDKGRAEDNLEQKRKDLMIAEAEVHSRHLQLISEIGRLMLKASRR